MRVNAKVSTIVNYQKESLVSLHIEDGSALLVSIPTSILVRKDVRDGDTVEIDIDGDDYYIVSVRMDLRPGG